MLLLYRAVSNLSHKKEEINTVVTAATAPTTEKTVLLEMLTVTTVTDAATSVVFDFADNAREFLTNALQPCANLPTMTMCLPR